MKSNTTINLSMFRLGGIAGICAGLFIITFALVSQSNGIIFVMEALSGGSIENWLKNLIANPTTSKFIFILPILGFSLMLVVAIVLYQVISESSWQKNLSLMGYLVGVPVVVSTFITHLSLINQIILFSAQTNDLASQVELYAIFAFHRWMVTNIFVGPFFIIIIGHTLMAWAAHKSNILPKWMAYWALLNTGLLVLSFLYQIFPVLEIAGMGAPLSMVWLIVLGLILLKKDKVQ